MSDSKLEFQAIEMLLVTLRSFSASAQKRILGYVAGQLAEDEVNQDKQNETKRHEELAEHIKKALGIEEKKTETKANA